MTENVAAIWKTWSFLWSHPISSRHRLAALGRWARWQVGVRLIEGQAIVPFVHQSRLLVRRGMTGATGNIYSGLQEFEEMAFALHLLRPDDLFVDVGANVGVYTVLAAAVAGARCVAVEPVPSTFRDLVANMKLNDIEGRVRTLQMAIGGEDGTCEFTADLDTVNHVLAPGESEQRTITVPVATLDDVLANENPTLLKVDVEGFETQVFAGGATVLGKSSLMAMIVELNGSGARYGFDDAAIARKFKGFGFSPYRYSPFDRRLSPSETPGQGGNALFIRDPEQTLQRLKSAAPFTVKGVSI